MRALILNIEFPTGRVRPTADKGLLDPPHALLARLFRWRSGNLIETARIYARTGEADQAIPLIERLLSTPAADGITLAELRLRWEWDPLRSDARFQKILPGPEPKIVY